MTASIIDGSSLSELTLALFEATGWYLADYSKADPLIYGKGLGCDFLFDPCISHKQAQWNFFCDTPNAPGCTFFGDDKVKHRKFPIYRSHIRVFAQ